ncbi:MAG: M20/M25/M40 family metallo-hydrolase [Thermovirgaceae bacterium]
MINEKRLLDNFLELVKIKAPSFEEKPLAEVLQGLLSRRGLDVIIDASMEETGSNTGNVIAWLEPSPGRTDWVAFSAHMDTVFLDREVSPRVKDKVVTSDGQTILGADDRAGIAVALEALEVLLEKGMSHPGIELVFSVAEEQGLVGAKALNRQDLKADRAFVLDSSMDPGHIIIAAPTQYKLFWTVHGKASHAGVAPEEGVSAILAAAAGIVQVPQGRIDEGTTANIGVIKGGKATNIVCDRVDIQAEGRSLDESKARDQVETMSRAMRDGVEGKGAWLEESRELSYPGFRMDKSDPVVASAVEAVRRCGLEPKLVSAGGGSDANILNGKGLPAVNLALGMEKVHTVEERIAAHDLVKAAEIVLQLMASG